MAIEKQMPRILVIDDEPCVRNSIMLALKKKDYEISLVANGQAGLEDFSAHHPDFIFLDLTMPGMSGAEVLAKIRQQDTQVPICVITGYEESFQTELDALREQGYQFDVVKKPASLNQIQETVQHGLGQST